MRHRDLRHRGSEAGHHVDHAGRQAGLGEQRHQVVRRKLRCRCGLPDDDVAHHRRRGRQVARDRGEVERRDGQHEALERPVVEPVPDAWRRDRLLGQDAAREVHVEAPEVGQLAGRVDVGLVARLALAQHRRGVDRVAPRARQQIGGLQEDGGSVVEAQRPPRRSNC